MITIIINTLSASSYKFAITYLYETLYHKATMKIQNIEFRLDGWMDGWTDGRAYERTLVRYFFIIFNP